MSEIRCNEVIHLTQVRVLQQNDTAHTGNPIHKLCPSLTPGRSEMIKLPFCVIKRLNASITTSGF